MVEYRQWVSVVFEVSKAKGLNTSKTENNAQVLSVAAEIWQERKNELRNASKSTAKAVADEEVSIS